MKTNRPNYIQIVERIRLLVRNAPDRAIVLERAACEAGVSPVRLHQIFFEIHGENYGAYVRRARLEHACGLMRAFPDWTCTRVAQEAGYSESSDFSRSFKRAFGIAPSRWDRVEPLNLIGTKFKNCQDFQPDSTTIPSVGFQKTPTIDIAPIAVCVDPQMRVAALSVADAIEPGNLKRAFDELEDWLQQNDQLRDGRSFLGLSYDSNLDTPAEQIRFELAHEVDASIEAKGSIVVRTIPQRRVAKLPCRGGPADFVDAWDHLLRVFLPRSRWRFGPGPQMEVYFNDPRHNDMIYWDMNCVIPIQPKQEGTHDWT